MTYRKLPIAHYNAARIRQDRRSAERELVRVFRPRASVLRRVLARITPAAARHYTFHTRIRRLERRASGEFCAVMMAG
ncbi:MAG: hypothetical protein ACRBCL_11810 [Maritimibacter sp.]